MTKLDVTFRLLKPLDDAAMRRLADAQTQRGIQLITLSPALDSVRIEYDATRLRPAEVEATLAAAGIDATLV